MLSRFQRPFVRPGELFKRTMSPVKDKVKGRMFSIQDCLPRLPVPSLNRTLDKYLSSVRPLLSDDDYCNTQRIVEDFRKGLGPKLQKLLEARAEKEENWLSEWWKQEAYLKQRPSVVINSNPGILFPRQNYTDQEGQLRFAAKLIAGVVDYKIMIHDNDLPVDTLGGKPLCMMQYYEILAACRIPGIRRDKHVCFPPTHPESPKHINVIHNNHIFTMDVFGSKCTPLNKEQLYKGLRKIVDQSSEPGHPIGLFTMQDRAFWAKEFNHLQKCKKNFSYLDNIRHSIVVVCLDEVLKNPAEKYDDPSFGAGVMLHGGGPNLHSGNRWFDKTLQVIISPQGVCGFNYEHTTAEGPPIANLMDFILDFCQEERDFPLPAADVRDPHRLNFTLDDRTLGALTTAKTHTEAMAKDVDLTVFTFPHFGKDFPKSVRLSPDAFIQMAFQLTYYRLYNRPCATYETGSLRRFHLGRTDTIRSCSMESLRFTETMDSEDTCEEEKVQFLKEAVAQHRKYTDEAISGQAIDRHLLGLKLTALEEGMDVPEIFMDYAYTNSVHYKISTSQVGAKHGSVLCFGPVVPDGYGICYNPQENNIIFSVSAFNVCPETNSRNFAKALEESLLAMQQLMASSQMSSKL